MAAPEIESDVVDLAATTLDELATSDDLVLRAGVDWLLVRIEARDERAATTKNRVA